MHPMNCYGTPEDGGPAATFLCSPDARFMTRAVLPMDGGATIGL